MDKLQVQDGKAGRERAEEGARMMLFKIRDHRNVRMPDKPLLLVCLIAVSAWGQTAGDLAAKYLSVSAYEVRPGILMTAKYAGDGQVCEMVLETRHYHTPDKVDLSSILPAKLEDLLIDELVPEAERGRPASRWLDRDSYMAGGVTYTKRSFENVSIEEHGSYSCNQEATTKGPLSCDDGGNEVVIIRWKKRTCAAPKAKTADSTKENNHTDTAAATNPPAEVTAQRSEPSAKMSQGTDTVDPATGNLRVTVPQVATTKPSH